MFKVPLEPIGAEVLALEVPTTVLIWYLNSTLWVYGFMKYILSVDGFRLRNKEIRTNRELISMK